MLTSVNKNLYKCLVPNLLEIQRASYCWFLEKGLIQELESFSAIKHYSGELELNFATKFYIIKQPRYSLVDTKRNDATYSVRIFIQAKLNYIAQTKLHEKRVFLGDIPLMTNTGTFIVNGIERVIINQIVRSPGIYYKSEIDKHGAKIYQASLISNRGSWVKFEIDKEDIINIRIDKAKKFSVYILLKALGLEDYEIFSGLDNPTYFRLTSQLNTGITTDECLLEIHNRLRPEESTTVKGGQQLLYAKFFDAKRYDLGYVGRHKLNQRLNLSISSDIRVFCEADALKEYVSLGF